MSRVLASRRLIVITHHYSIPYNKKWLSTSVPFVHSKAFCHPVLSYFPLQKGLAASIVPTTQPQRFFLSSSTRTTLVMFPKKRHIGGTDRSVVVDDHNCETNSQDMAEAALVVDNPCWGSPVQCDLRHLLDTLDQAPNEHDPTRERKQKVPSSCILYESPNFIVLNKPPDLRMDGEFPATVHKLLTYWYPSPSLLESLQKTKTNTNTKTTLTDSQPASVSTSPSTQLELLQAVSKLHKNNHLPDNELRPVHQLDYATSGVLCIARTIPAAAAATVIFEVRTATKTYTAVVEGHMPDISEQPSNHHHCCPWPILSQSHIDECLHTAEDQYRRTRGKSEIKHQADTFPGFQPTHAVFGKWKSMIQQQQQEQQQHQQQQQPPSQQNKSSKKRKQPSLLSNQEWADVWTSVGEVSPSTELLGQSWKQLCQQSPHWKTPFEQAATRHNDILRRKLMQQREKEEEDKAKAGSSLSHALPIVCRVSEERNDQGTTSTTTTTSLYIYAPLAQVSNEFGMKVPASVLKELASKDDIHVPNSNNISSLSLSSSSLLSTLLEGSTDLDYKPSLTKCTILSRAYYHGRPVTKVQLYPKTGRRHQLRVHLALLGHPILGDATYSASSIYSQTTIGETMATTRANRNGSAQGNDGTTSLVGSEENNLVGVPHRMCLHAQSLELPLETTVLKNEEPYPWKIVAPDPFLVSEKGELSISY